MLYDYEYFSWKTSINDNYINSHHPKYFSKADFFAGLVCTSGHL